MADKKTTSSDERTPLLDRLRSVSSDNSQQLQPNVAPLPNPLAIPDDPNAVSNDRDHNDEEALLDSDTAEPASEPKTSGIGRIVSVLLIGGFISNADGSLLLATHPVIASEFNALDDSSWLLTSFAIAQAATQPLYGKLSDIYGRKQLLLVAYALFGLGLVLVGIGHSMTHLIVGRVISGAGAAGMTSLVSILITDLVPLRDVASWRSYVNLVATTGRSLGGPVGGWLADTVGWRYSFLLQVPFAVVAMVLIVLTIPSEQQTQKDDNAPKQSKLQRIDFIGATLMTLTILAFLLPLEIGGVKVPWSSPLIFSLLSSGVFLAALFLLSQAYIAKEPIFPLELLRQRDVVASIIVSSCQGGAQMGLMIAVPLYFQITANASNTVAGAHLFPAVFGNAVGGILSGIIIKRSGRYKSLVLFATLAAASAYLLLILRWHGNTNWLESLYIFPGGFGTGIAQSALFISLQAAIDPSHMAVAAASLYLAFSVGAIGGMAGVSAVLQSKLRSGLDKRLDDLGFDALKRERIIEGATSDVHYIDRASAVVAKAVVRSYVEALTWTHGLSFVASLTAFVAALFIRQHKL